MRYALLLLALMAGCQFETYNVTITGGSEDHRGLKQGHLKYKGHEADASSVNIIYINGSPVSMEQKQEDVGSGNEASATGL